MHWCYVSARDRDAACTSRSDARTMQSQSRTLRGAAARAREAVTQLALSLLFFAAKRPKNHLTTGSRSLSSNTTNLTSRWFRELALAALARAQTRCHKSSSTPAGSIQLNIDIQPARVPLAVIPPCGAQHQQKPAPRAASRRRIWISK